MISLVAEYFLAIALFFSFITLIFYGFPVAWTMGGLGVLFIFISMLSDNLLDTFYGVDFGFASMVVYRLYGVMANWVLVALPMFIFMGIMMDKSGIAEDLMTDLSKLFGKTRGGLAISIVFIGVLPRMTDSLHPGNGGNPAFGNYDLDSNMRLVFYPAVIGWILIGSWIAQLRFRIKLLEINQENI